MQSWDDYFRAYKLPAYQTASPNAAQRDLARKVEKEHNYRFKYPPLLRCAFQHPSVPKLIEGLPSLQRLEFLGDSLLDMTAVMHLYHNNPTRDAQWLTEHKMAMVSNKFLGALSVRLGFHRHLKHVQASLSSQIEAYLVDIEEVEKNANGARDYWTKAIDPPKCLADIVESYVGAMFVDSSFSYAEVQRFFDEHILWYFEDIKIYDTFANNHPVVSLFTPLAFLLDLSLFQPTFSKFGPPSNSLLNKLEQIRLNDMLTNIMHCHDFALRSRDIPATDAVPAKALALVMVHGQALGDSMGSSSRYAKIRACNAAIKRLENMRSVDFKRKYGCDCKAEKVAGGDGASGSVVMPMEELIGTAV